MQESRNILVLLDMRLNVHRNFAMGLHQYAFAKHLEWCFVTPGWHLDRTLLRAIPDWDLDAGAGHVDRSDAEVMTMMGRISFPFVNFSGGPPLKGIAQVGPDDLAIGRLAAEYFAELGFRDLAVLNPHGTVTLQNRLKEFREEVSRRQLRCHELDSHSPDGRPLGRGEFNEYLRRRLTDIPKPMAVFGMTDAGASSVLKVCRELSLRVPEDVAILGVENDPLICLASRPQLSSIELPAEQSGYEAGRVLEELLENPADTQSLLLPPQRVVSRHSTDIVAIDDPVVAEAVRFIRENACKPISVEDVLYKVMVSRRGLGERFRKAIGRSIFQEIRRIQIQRVHELLKTTDLPIKQIARQTGFSDSPSLARAYRKATGTTTTAYRDQFRKT